MSESSSLRLQKNKAPIRDFTRLAPWRIIAPIAAVANLVVWNVFRPAAAADKYLARIFPIDPAH
jgi:hypothetical protein